MTDPHAAGIEPDRITRVEVDRGVDLHVREWTGHLRPMVLVHGLASNARMWDGVAVTLADAGHPVFAIDQRGHGRSAKPIDGYDMNRVVADLAGLLDALHLEAPVVAGQSWGGNVVVELAATHPGRTGSVVGIDGGTIHLAERFPSWDDAARTLRPPNLVGRPVDEIEVLVRSMHPDWPDSGIEGAMGCYEVRADDTIAPWLDLDRHLQVLRGLWEHDPFAAFDRITDPVVLVTAGPDPDDGAAAASAENPDADWQRSKVEGVAEAGRRLSSVAPVGDRPGFEAVWIEGDHDLHAQHPRRIGQLLAAVARDLG